MVGASLLGAAGCDDNKTTSPDAAPPNVEPKGTFNFTHGVASGDPRASSVVLWTRVVRGSDAAADVAVRVQVAADPNFGKIYAEKLVAATSASDHTVRVLVTQLPSDIAFYYRFTAGQDEIVGRTRTAPEADADVQINLAWVSCQDYGAGHYGAYRQLMIDDDARADADKIHAVVHLGDMIYETRDNGFQTAIDENFQAIALTNRDGSPRGVAAFPSGGGTRGSANFAATVDDYRHLYKTFLSDPDLQAARARWPFISVWDDHEFTDDCWQSQANYISAATADEGDQTRRIAASQAWFEYVPVHLTGAGGVAGVANQAKDFAPAVVKDAAFTAANDDNFVAETNNAKAVGAITIYRSLRFGKHVELVMTDERSYRSDHAIPEDIIAAAPAGTFFAPRNALPLPIVNIMDQGRTANGGNPPTTLPGGIPNARAASPVGTMLGKAQKAWWKDTMKKSDATWKLWGNEVPLMRLRIKASGTTLPADLVISADAWDGYPTERAELMTYLKDQGIKNVVVLSGDVHASFAGVIMDDFDAATPAPVACELVAAGITSNSLFSFFEAATRPPVPAALRGIITVDATSAGGAKFTENFNLLLLQGTVAAGAFAQNLAVVPQTFDPTTNPHLKYADTNAQGYGYVKVTGDEVKATIVTVNRPIVTPSAANPTSGVKRTASITIPKNNPGGMTGPVFTGTKPFPLDHL